MSVKVCDRTTSKLEAVYHATEVRKEIHDLCIRDLAIKDLESLVRKKWEYRADPKQRLDNYVLLLHQSKQRLHNLADDLIASTTLANRRPMNSLENCDKRLVYQERALDDCFLLVGKLQDVADIFLVDLNRYRPSIESIDKEVHLLKGWIKYTNKIRKTYL